MGDKDDYLTSYRVFFEKFAATVDPKDQLPVNIAGYTITQGELAGEVLYWTAEYLSEIQCPPTLMTTLRRIVLDEVLIASKKHPDEFGYDPNECEYEALRLMQAVTSKVNDVCLRYLDNSHLDTLPPPPPVSQRGFRSASAAVKNMRRVMEDRHVEISNLEALFGIETDEPTGFFAVYDGHAGAAAATYCAAHLHQYLVESACFKRDLKQALYDAFVKTDLEFVRKSHQKRACGGSTAVVVCVRGRQLVAAWAGDSLAVLAKRMGLLQLVNPHKPNRPDETIRIQSSGGVVIHLGTWRVNGQLAVSRAIGNAQYKPYVTAQPEIEVVDLDGDEDFVVVACDGLWDVVNEDAVAYSVYEQLMRNPDDVKAVTSKLVRQAKENKSQDNITVIVVFLKDPRNIAADNRPPMDLGLENAVVNPPPFAVENEACKMVHGGGFVETDNGVSDSDSDDLGPETAVDQDLEVEENHDPAPTAPANTVDSSHVDGNLVDNVAESGEESEDEWNYYKGEGEREHNPSEEADEATRSETPCQDNSACESSSVDMNSSPLNPDAPVFVPGGVAGSDVLLAESPRKPLPMDDIELIDEAQFQTEAVIRPAELQDLDSSELNGHHNISMEGVTEHANGIDKSEMESLGFGFNVGIEEKLKNTSFTQDFERIQKDTTDFCNIQVFQSHTETNPFSDHGDDELFERLKNKERDPMSMSFYQEKDDDTCERFGKIESNVDLNAVQPLPESDDEDIQPNGECIIKNEEDKENLCPEEKADLFGLNENLDEPNNDILKFDDRSDNLTNNVSNLTNFVDFTVHNANNMQSYNTDFDCINQEEVAQTDTPESHKLLFEQIPEIPDGKSSELSFNNEDLLDPSESESNIRAITPQDEEISQDVEMEIKLDELHIEQADETSVEVPEIRLETEDDSDALENPKSQSVTHSPSPVPSESPLPQESSTFPAESPLPQEPLLPEETLTRESPMPQESSLLRESPLPQESSLLRDSPLPHESRFSDESPLPQGFLPRESPLPQEFLPSESPLPKESPLPQEPLPSEYPILDEPTVCNESPNPAESPVPIDIGKPVSSPLVMSPVPSELRTSPLPAVSLQTTEIVEPVKSLFEFEDLEAKQESLVSTVPSLPSHVSIEAQSPAEVPLPRESPLPCDSPLPKEREEQIEVSILVQQATQNKELPIVVPIDQSEKIFENQVTSDIFGLKETSTISDDIEKLSPVPNEEFEAILSQSPLPVEQTDEAVKAFVKSDETNCEGLLQEQVLSPEPIIDIHPSETSLSTEKTPLNGSLVPIDIETTQTDVLLESSRFSQVESSTEYRTVESIESKIFASELSEPIMSVPAPVESIADSDHSRLTPEMAQEAFDLEATDPAAASGAPAPDLLPHQLSHERPRNELVTDIDIGIPESRAQEICVPVTSEIQPEDGVRPGTTPPPTPAVEPVQPSLGDAPIAAATAAVAVAAAATAAVAASKGVSKKSPTTPTPKTDSRTPRAATKTTTAARTPASVTKKLAPSPSAAAPRSPAPRTPASVAKASPAPRPSPRPAPIAKPSPKPAAPAAARPSAPAAAAAARSAAPAAARTAAPAAARSAALARSAPAPRAAPKAPATKPAAPAAPRTAAAKPASATRSAAAPRPVPTAAPAAKPKETKPKSAAPKPLTNGDVKPISRPAPRPAPPPARAAPRAAPRPAAPAPPAPAPLKSAPARPAARAALDKQSKDLANKRITAKTAPPRTATKASTGVKSVPRLGKKSVDNKESLNGAPLKAPPSPPADALLPDVIA